MKTWKTREGLEIPIDEMTDNHLNNAIAYLERTAKVRLESEVEELAFGPVPDGDMASYMFDVGMDRLYGLSPEDYLAGDDAYQSLIAERERRLTVDN